MTRPPQDIPPDHPAPHGDLARLLAEMLALSFAMPGTFAHPPQCAQVPQDDDTVEAAFDNMPV